MNNYPANISDSEWSKYYGSQEETSLTEAECEKCGLSAYCYHENQWLCIDHAVEEWFDELTAIVDPADLGFDVEYDVRTDEADELIGFTAQWERGGTFEGQITLEELKEIRKELKR